MVASKLKRVRKNKPVPSRVLTGTSKIGPGTAVQPEMIHTSPIRETHADEIGHLKVGDHVEFPADPERTGIWRITQIREAQPKNEIALGAKKLWLLQADGDSMITYIVPKRPAPPRIPPASSRIPEPSRAEADLFAAEPPYDGLRGLPRRTPSNPAMIRWFESAVCGCCEGTIPAERIHLCPGGDPHDGPVAKRLAECPGCDTVYVILDRAGGREVSIAGDPADLAEARRLRERFAGVRRYDDHTDRAASQLVAQVSNASAPLTGDPFDGL